jgi:hypothetical protein
MMPELFVTSAKLLLIILTAFDLSVVQILVLYLIIQGVQKVSVYLTITVYKIDDLKTAITEYTRNVDRSILNTVFENTVRRVNKCMETGGGHFAHYL